MNENIILNVVNNFLSERIEREIMQVAKKDKVEKIPYEQELVFREKYSINNWLNHVAKNASQVSLNITHVAKLTHSSSRASNVTDSVKQCDNLHLLTTQTANATERDLAYTNATLSPIADFLSIPIEGEVKSLGEFLAEDPQYLTLLSDDKSTRIYWQSSIAEAYQPTALTSHVLAKQVYFPLNDQNEKQEDHYHLISPMVSSALAHKVYRKIRESRDDKSELNKAYRTKEWHDGVYTRYDNIGILSVTKSNHQNASRLNGARNGNLSLFYAAPPIWRKSSTYSRANKLTMKQFFFACYQDGCGELFIQLKNWIYFLEKEQAFLNVERKIFIAEIIQQICEAVFQQILLLQMRLQNQQEKWENIPVELQPFMMFENTDHIENNEQRSNRLSQAERETVIETMVQATTQWISERIEDKKRTVDYEKLWSSLMKKPFREFYAVLEAK